MLSINVKHRWILSLAFLAFACLFSHCKRAVPDEKGTPPKIETAAKNTNTPRDDVSPQPSKPESPPKEEQPEPAVPVQEPKKKTDVRQETKPSPHQPKPEKAIPSSPSPAVEKSTVSIAPKAEEQTPSEPPAADTPPVSPKSEEKQADTIPSGSLQPGAGTKPSHGSDEPGGSVEEPAPVEQPEPPSPPEEPEEKPARSNSATLKSLPDIRPMSCSDPSLSFDDFLLAAAKNFEKQKIAYNSIPLSDCSGMFHRLAIAVKDFCPDYTYPEPEEARDTRALASWYYDHNNLAIIQDAAASGQLIRPGSVMFFGNSEVKYTNITIDKIAVKGGIEHMGTVVSVEKDKNDKVVAYTMFHGRNPSKPAGTTVHKLKNSNKKVPPYGNWTQQWVAVANIATLSGAQPATAQPTDIGQHQEPSSSGNTPPATSEKTPVVKAVPAPNTTSGQQAGQTDITTELVTALTPVAAMVNLPDIQPMGCSDPSLSFDDFLLAAAKNFEKQKIAYNSIPLSDCSGMFHRLAIAVKDFCPDYTYPEPEEARDTRALASWYYDHNNLAIIQDAAASGQLIRPGSVMFFGNSEVKYTNITIDKIAVKGGIEHMGTVVSVEKDKNDKVVAYTMFHGRNPSKPAGTTVHKLKNSNKKVPPYGNWTQQWVAVANIATQ